VQIVGQIWWHGCVAYEAHERVKDENRRLKKIYAEERLKAEIAKDIIAKKW
jgi:hypothetical protein